jgi:patatin-like phospholipase/acyl hydrolase
MASPSPLRILCLDGGGIRGLASLYMLKELMAQVRRERDFEHLGTPRVPIKPYQYFDLICGTSTGGLIALLVGRLQYVSPHDCSSFTGKNLYLILNICYLGR